MSGYKLLNFFVSFQLDKKKTRRELDSTAGCFEWMLFIYYDHPHHRIQWAFLSRLSFLLDLKVMVVVFMALLNPSFNVD